MVEQMFFLTQNRLLDQNITNQQMLFLLAVIRLKKNVIIINQ